MALSPATSSREGPSHRMGSWRSENLILILTLNLGVPSWEVWRATAGDSGLEQDQPPGAWSQALHGHASIYTLPVAALVLEGQS